MAAIKYGLFLDNHTMPNCPDLGKNFDPERFADALRECGIDALTFHARCNVGMAYYDTKIGIRHPNLNYDLFGTVAGVCARRGIRLTAYFNGGISYEESLRHREWSQVHFDGTECYHGISPSLRTMCVNSSYRDHLTAMMAEVAENYSVQGFFVDCLLTDFTCVCPVCVREMREQGFDPRKLEDVREFRRLSCIRLARDIVSTLRKIKPDLSFFFNGITPEDQSGTGTYLECECLPNCPCWGYEFLPVMAHYLRNFGKKPVLNMNGRFYEWGDFGGLRHEAAIRSELLYGMMNGMRPNIGSHFHPRGDFVAPVYEMVRKIYRDLQALDPWVLDAVNRAEVAIVYPKSTPVLSYSPAVRGAVRMLGELKVPFEIVTEACGWDHFRLLIFPDDVPFTDSVTERIRHFLAAGGIIISSGTSGFTEDGTRFALEKEWGVRLKGKSDMNPAYFTAREEFGKGVPEMPVSLYVTGYETEPLPGTTVGAELVKPFFNRGYDGLYCYYYNPPDTSAGLPLLTWNGQVACFAYPIFTGYHEKAPLPLRTLFANVLEKCLEHPMVRTEKLPSFVRLEVQKKGSLRLIHLLAVQPELRGKTEIIEDLLTVRESSLEIRMEETVPSKVYLAPERKELPFETRDGYVRIRVPEFTGYELIVLER